jgi:hypothetical protein
MHASPAALINACMSFRIAQLGESRTAPAAHGNGGWQEGPATITPPPCYAAKSWSGGGGVAKSQDGRQRASVLILEAMPLAGYGAIFEAWSHARARERRIGAATMPAARLAGRTIVREGVGWPGWPGGVRRGQDGLAWRV